MSNESFQAISANSPFIAWIHNISLNQQKFMKSRFKEFDLGHDVRYIMFIYDNPNCSQEDLVKLFGQSKGNIAKTLKKLENLDLIERKINPKNRRKYMLKTTAKGNKLIPKYRQLSKEWEREVGITQDDENLKKRIKEIAIKGMEITNDY